jgi:hypothetical protein
MPSLGPKAFPGIVKGVIIIWVERLNVCRACGQAVAGPVDQAAAKAPRINF